MSVEPDWVPGYSNDFLLAFAMYLADEEELVELCDALEALTTHFPNLTRICVTLQKA